MKFDKRFRRISAATVAVSAIAVAAVVSAGGPSGKGGGKPPKNPTTTAAPATTTVASTYNQVDADFVEMMIPHHFQATVMSALAPGRTDDEALLALADRIVVEQDVEIGMMQNWQSWNGLSVTDAETSYEMMLGMPAMLETMGMATPAEMEQLAAMSDTDFQRRYLELMIDHHSGALAMFEDVILTGSDSTLHFWANDMMTGQTAQIFQMEDMLAGLG